MAPSTYPRRQPWIYEGAIATAAARRLTHPRRHACIAIGLVGIMPAMQLEDINRWLATLAAASAKAHCPTRPIGLIVPYAAGRQR